MRLKLKLNKRQLMLLTVAAAAICALLISRSAPDEQPGTLDDAASRACSDFADGYPAARTQTARLALADRVIVSANRTGHSLIATRAAEMGRSANGSNAGWTASAGALTGACQDAGWTAAAS